MGFNADKFMQTKFVARESTIRVNALSSFFDEGEEPMWTVRGLNTNEVQRASDALKRQSSIENILTAIAEGGDQVKALREAIGMTKGTPGEVAKRLEMLVMGSVSPKLELQTAVKIAEAFPVEFLQLTNEITVLTGQGFDIVKPVAASSTILDSAQA